MRLNFKTDNFFSDSLISRNTLACSELASFSLFKFTISFLCLYYKYTFATSLITNDYKVLLDIPNNKIVLLSNVITDDGDIS